MNQPRPYARTAVLCAGLLAGGLLLSNSAVRSADAKKPDPAAVERARDTAKLLDDLYKNYVVDITKTYVRAQEKTPAATVTKRVFKAMHDKGWHTGRLVDATGKPFNEANAPKTAFEKKAVMQIKAGKGYFEEIGTKEGAPVLRVATVVPVVMKECSSCHTDHKKGDVLGALIYEVPIK